MDIIKSTKQKQKQVLEALLNDETVNDRLLAWCGYLCLENHYWELAESFFSCLSERRKKSTDFFYLAQALLNQKRYQEAEECLLEFIYQVQKPCLMLFRAYKNLGQIAMLMESYLTAEEYYNKAYSIDKDSASLLFQRSILKIKQKDYEQAEKFIQHLLCKNPGMAKAWLSLAVIRHTLKDEEMATSCLNRCLDLDPQNSKALYLQQRWDTNIPLDQQFKYAS